mgnify:CR=1 FL=1
MALNAETIREVKYALEEARMGAEVLHVILETVKKRNP